jgi:hypothetical protein
MSEEEEKRKQQFATLKRYLEQEQARVDREMPGATDKEKMNVVAAKLSDSLAASREKKAMESLTAVLRGVDEGWRGMRRQKLAVCGNLADGNKSNFV